jgi:hypothetical protein
MVSLKEKFFLSYYSQAYSMSDTEVLVFKNPSPSEWGKYVPEGARGFIDTKGDLFIEGIENKGPSNRYSNTLHDELLENLGMDERYARKFHMYKDEELDYGICIQRWENTNIIVLSESVQFYNSGNVTKLFELCQKKNPNFEFKVFNTNEYMGHLRGYSTK